MFRYSKDASDGRVKELLISFIKRHKPVTSDTVSRGIKDALSHREADIGVCGVYNAYSSKSLSLSKARDIGISVRDILNPLSANPTKWSNTLKQFLGYCQRIV